MIVEEQIHHSVPLQSIQMRGGNDRKNRNALRRIMFFQTSWHDFSSIHVFPPARRGEPDSTCPVPQSCGSGGRRPFRSEILQPRHRKQSTVSRTRDEVHTQNGVASRDNEAQPKVLTKLLLIANNLIHAFWALFDHIVLDAPARQNAASWARAGAVRNSKHWKYIIKNNEMDPSDAWRALSDGHFRCHYECWDKQTALRRRKKDPCTVTAYIYG